MAAETAPAPPETGQEGGNALTRKIGPLPVWGWAVVVAGAVLVARALGGSKAPTGGESYPPVGDPGFEVVPGVPGPQGPAGTLPTGYATTLNAIMDWFQRLDATTRLIARLRTQIANTNDKDRKRKLQNTLDKATGETKIEGGKFTYGGTTYYQTTWITKQINELQEKLAGLK